ncbi:MAG: DUF1501 domain-containing protein [Planctomycetota bacterium]|nr:MAG: DUF1501 domain-containing protein [Planctomycetota bacterium]
MNCPMPNNNLLNVCLNRDGQVSRRRLLQVAGGGFAGLGGLPFLQRLGLAADEARRNGRACIVVFLNGAPSQFETWNPKPGTENGGPTQVIDTAIPGVPFAEYWPKLAAMMNDVSVIRTMAGKEAAHDRGTYHLLTGRRLGGASRFPHFGSVVSHELGDPDAEIPNFISIGDTLNAGFLGVRFSPFVVPRAGELPANVEATVAETRVDRRLSLLADQDADFQTAGAERIAAEHQELYRKAARLMTSEHLKAFTVEGESDAVKSQYGRHEFGQGCLIARRLVESGVPFVQVRRSGWDMHANLWQNIPRAAGEVDEGVSALLTDLKQRGMLEKTLVVVLGEFGRTPKINQSTPNVGRDHFARNFNLLMAGGGIKGGVCVGTTSSDGMEIDDRPVEVDDFFHTMCRCMGIDADKELITPEGRPLRIVDAGAPVEELLS